MIYGLFGIVLVGNALNFFGKLILDGTEALYILVKRRCCCCPFCRGKQQKKQRRRLADGDGNDDDDDDDDTGKRPSPRKRSIGKVAHFLILLVRLNDRPTVWRPLAPPPDRSQWD